jgi:transcriptional regulator with XRE-family HTH domain
MPDLRSIIDAERDRQGLTVYALATRARVSERALGLFLRGERECRSDVLVRIFAALSLRVVRA